MFLCFELVGLTSPRGPYIIESSEDSSEDRDRKSRKKRKKQREKQLEPETKGTKRPREETQNKPAKKARLGDWTGADLMKLACFDFGDEETEEPKKPEKLEPPVEPEKKRKLVSPPVPHPKKAKTNEEAPKTKEKKKTDQPKEGDKQKKNKELPRPSKTKEPRTSPNLEPTKSKASTTSEPKPTKATTKNIQTPSAPPAKPTPKETKSAPKDQPEAPKPQQSQPTTKKLATVPPTEPKPLKKSVDLDAISIPKLPESNKTEAVANPFTNPTHPAISKTDGHYIQPQPPKSDAMKRFEQLQAEYDQEVMIAEPDDEPSTIQITPSNENTSLVPQEQPINSILSQPLTTSTEDATLAATVGFSMPTRASLFKEKPKEKPSIPISMLPVPPLPVPTNENHKPVPDPAATSTRQDFNRQQLAPKGGRRPCRFYNTPEGCKAGKACQFKHIDLGHHNNGF